MKVAFFTLGCKVNTYETEAVLSDFKNKGYDIVSFEETADIYVINTCSVTNASDVKSRKIIRQASKRNAEAVIVVMGCYSQLKESEVAEIEGVDIIVGTNNKMEITKLVEEFLKHKKQLKTVNTDTIKTFEDMELNNFENKTRAFVKIQDGCDNYCSYCIIPYARGNVRSKPKEKVISEVEALVANGYVEVVLTGIHTGSYGKDIKGYTLANLLEELVTIDNLKRIRISSIEITELTDDMLGVLQKYDKIANHLHIPLQSGSDKILKLMNRKYNKEFFELKIEEIKTIRPDIAITTDVIAGFPGETLDDFNETLDFIEKISFSGIHAFPYSKRDKTKAASMPNQIDGKIKKERVEKLTELSKKLEIKYINKFLREVVDFIPEKKEDGYLTGHSSNYLKLKLKTNENLIGKYINVKVEKVDYPYCIVTKF